MTDTNSAAADGTTFSGPVRKAKSAFLFYQTEMLSKIRNEMGGSTVSMGDAMTEVGPFCL